MSNKGFQMGSSSGLGLRTQAIGVVGLDIHTVLKSGTRGTDKADQLLIWVLIPGMKFSITAIHHFEWS